LKTSTKDIHKKLIELCIAGNVKAEYQLYHLYSGAMFNVCMRLINRREEAEDVLQEAFSEIFDKLETFRYESGFGSWAKKIVINKALNHLKRRKPQLILTGETNELSSEDDHPDFNDIEMKVEDVRKAIESLPEGYRVVFSLFMFEGYDHSEIADILNISESTSKTQYMKAKRKIKELLSK